LEKRDGLRDWTPLIWAVMEEQPAILELLIRSGADVTAKDSHLDRTALLWAASTGNKVAVELLLWSDNALVNAIDKDGKTSLDLAYFEGHMETAQILIANMLIEKGADLEAKDGEGNTALLWAVWLNDERMVEILVGKKADVAAEDGEGITVRDWAARMENENIIQLLPCD
ncbi:ankyrin, partial [Decorospora gaudefroyi]